MKIENLCDQLLKDGWREYPDRFKKPSRCFFKRFQTKTRCLCNNDRPGIQIEASVSNNAGDEFPPSIEFHMTGQIRDESWFSLTQYGLPGNLKKASKVIPRMLNAWEAANRNP